MKRLTIVILGLLAKVVANEASVRDYVIGGSHAVTGPRAYIRTKDYEEIAMILKDKLLNIVLGDNRIEVAWGPMIIS